MRMSHWDLAYAFAGGAKQGRSNSMLIDGDVMYSYGHHYPLAIRHPTNGDWGCGVEFIINSAGYSATTGRHIGIAKRALPNPVHLSFNALEAAGVLRHRAGIPDPAAFRFVKIEDDFFVIETPEGAFRYNNGTCAKLVHAVAA